MSASDTSSLSHYDDDTLALIALGEADAAPDHLAHLQTCEVCSTEVASLRQVVAVGRTAHDATLAEPPASVWDGIQAAIAVPAAAGSAPAAGGDAAVVTLDDHRKGKGRSSRVMTWVGVAAAIGGIVAGVAITSLVTTKSDAPRPVATAPLTGEAVKVAHGTATLTYNKQNQPELTIKVSDLPSSDRGFYEVWLMNAKPVRFVALGVLNGNHSGTFQLPPNLPAKTYDHIDVSLQPFNGSPLHSGISVVRGPIPSASAKA